MVDKPAPAAPAAPDLQKQYELQKAAVDAAQTKLTDATKDLATQQSTLQNLQTRVNEINQAVAGYDKTLQDRLDQSQKALGTKLDNAKTALKDLTAKIDNIVTSFDHDLSAQKEAVDKTKADAATAAGDADKANATLQSTQADLDAEKKSPRTIDAGLQELKSLLDQITKAEAQNDYVAVYFLANETKTKADALGKIPTADEYSTNLKVKEAAVSSAKDDLKNKKAAAAAAEDAYTKLQQKYEAASKSRQADIVSALKAVHPKAA